MTLSESPSTAPSVNLPRLPSPNTTATAPRARFLSRIKRYNTLVEPLTPRVFLLLLLESDVIPAETPELDRAYLDGLKSGEATVGEVDIDGLLTAKKYSQAIDKIMIHILRVRMTTKERAPHAETRPAAPIAPEPVLEDLGDEALDPSRPPPAAVMRQLYPKPTASSSLLLARPPFTSPHTPTRLLTLVDPISKALGRLYESVWTQGGDIYHGRSANIPQARASIDTDALDLTAPPVPDLANSLLTDPRLCEYTMMRPKPIDGVPIPLVCGNEMLDRILVTASFRRLYGILVEESEEHAVLCGQSGIGKSTFLTYVLIDRLHVNAPTVLITSNANQTHAYLFGDKGAYFLPPTAELHRYIPADSWVLIDADHPDEEIMAKIKNLSGVRIIQAVTPSVNAGSMLRDIGAVDYWLTPFPWVELYIIGCRGLSKTPPYLLAHSYFTFGPLTRTVLHTSQSTTLRAQALSSIQIALSSLPAVLSIPAHPLHITNNLHQCLFVARSTPSHTTVTTVPASLYIALALTLEGLSRGSVQTLYLLTEMRSSTKQRKRAAGLFLGAMEGRVDCCAWPYGRRAFTDRNTDEGEEKPKGIVESL